MSTASTAPSPITPLCCLGVFCIGRRHCIRPDVIDHHICPSPALQCRGGNILGPAGGCGADDSAKLEHSSNNHVLLLLDGSTAKRPKTIVFCSVSVKMYKRLDEVLLTLFEGGSSGHSVVLLDLVASWSRTRAHRGTVYAGSFSPSRCIVSCSRFLCSAWHNVVHLP
jgi:hypothetical protein